MANSALGQTGFGADAIATSNVQNSAITAAKIADDTVTEAKLAAGATLQLGTMQASTSGTSIDFTGIPAGTKQIIVTFNGMSTNGTSNFLIQLGDSGGVETSGYTAGTGGSDGWGSGASSSAGFILLSAGSGSAHYGSFIITLHDAATFAWIGQGTIAYGGSFTAHGAGGKALSAELDRVRITTVNGTDTFDAGSINIAYK